MKKAGSLLSCYRGIWIVLARDLFSLSSQICRRGGTWDRRAPRMSTFPGRFSWRLWGARMFRPIGPVGTSGGSSVSGRSRITAPWRGGVRRTALPFEIRFVKPAPPRDRETYLNECCMGGECRDELTPIPPKGIFRATREKSRLARFPTNPTSKYQQVTRSCDRSTGNAVWDI